MAAKKLINGGKRYEGKFVATESFNNKTVVASGKNPDAVIARAAEKGCKSPVVFFVPDRNTIHIY